MFFVIPGKPIALARARMGKGIFYDSQYQVKKNILDYLNFKHFIPFIKPLILELEFYFEMPKSWSKKKKREKHLQPHIQTPDCSNLIKFVEDTFNGKIWIDDKIIVKIVAIKIWSNKSETKVKVMEYGSLNKCTKYS